MELKEQEQFRRQSLDMLRQMGIDRILRQNIQQTLFLPI